jgi:hypothetical protein
MHAIKASRLVGAWERGQAQHPLHRALTLLRVAEPERSIDDLAMLPIGERDRRLLELRRQLFGNRFDAVSACPRCGEKVELNFSTEQLPLAPVAECIADGARLPNTSDLLAIATEPPDQRAARLLARCTGTDLAGAEADEAERRLAQADPMARIEMRLACPRCEHEWSAFFDIASFLWTELNDWVRRLFCETHTLARAYGWSEAEILGMSPQRRQVYLDLIAGG